METGSAIDKASNLCTEMNKIQVELCKSSKNLEINVEESKKKVRYESKALIDRIRESENLALKILDQMAKRRRDEVNKVNLDILTYFKPKVDNLKHDMENLIVKGDGCEVEIGQLAELEREISGRVSLQHMPAIETFRIQTPKLSSVFSIESSVHPADIRLWYHPQNSTNDKLQIGLELSNTAIDFPRILYSDLVIAIFSVKRGSKRLVMEKDFKSLIDQGNDANLEIQVTQCNFELVYEVSNDQRSNQYIIAASLNNNFVKDCPLYIDIDQNLDSALQPLNTEGNVTRTGKCTSDLDKSDMIAMGYINKTMMNTVPEEEEDDGGKGRNVSFHHMITVHDGSHAESALTKEVDGTFSLHKSLLNRSNGHDDTNILGDLDNPPQSPSLWKKSPDSIANYIENKRIEGMKEREENEAAARDLNEIWDSSLKTPWSSTSQCNFGNERYVFISQPSICIPINPSLPQSIAVDGKRIFVSDVFNSAVYFFFDGNFRGNWPTGHVFRVPRYVICLQSDTNPEGNKDVVVMDETSITHFDANGAIKAELRQSYVERFRGLDFHHGYNQFVTTEKNRLGIKVVFFSLVTGIERKLNISDRLYCPIQVSRTKCVFLKSFGNRIFVTDLGNGMILVLDLESGTSRKILHANESPLNNLMGIDVDNYGNIVAATSADTDEGVSCNLEIFNADEKHIQTCNIQGIKPSGLCLQGNSLYLAEILSKRIDIFTLYDKSVL